MPAFKMNYDIEADYIESVDFKAPGKSFNYDPYCFIRYCNMQYNGALKSNQINAADRIALVRENAFNAFHARKI